jgi:hypothetical protein
MVNTHLTSNIESPNHVKIILDESYLLLDPKGEPDLLRRLIAPEEIAKCIAQTQKMLPLLPRVRD